MAIQIEYGYTKYISTRDFNEPIPVEHYNLIKRNKKDFFRALKKDIVKQFKEEQGIFKQIAFYITIIYFAMGIGIPLILASGSQLLDNLEKSDSFYGVIGVAVVLGFIFLPFGLGYFKSRDSLDDYIKITEKYYNVHSNYAEESTDYNHYLKLLKS